MCTPLGYQKKNVLVEKHKNCIKLDFYLPDHLQIYHTTALTLLKACIIHCLTNKDWASCAFLSDICTPLAKILDLPLACITSIKYNSVCIPMTPFQLLFSRKSYHKKKLVALYSRGGEWYLQNLGTDPNVSSDMEISAAFAKSLKVWFILRLFRCEVLHVLVLVWHSQARISVSRRISHFTICHPLFSKYM